MHLLILTLSCKSSGITIGEASAIVISVIALAFSIIQFRAQETRSRRIATIEAFDRLEKNVFLDKDYKNSPVREGLQFAISDMSPNEIESWNKATGYLQEIEHFSVGINSQVYDIETLNKMSGGFIIKEYQRWKPIIDTKRKQDNSQKHYDEFEKMYKKLEEMRNIN